MGAYIYGCTPGRTRTLSDRSVVWRAIHYTTEASLTLVGNRAVPLFHFRTGDMLQGLESGTGFEPM